MFLLFRTKDDLPAYNSGDEELDECALCKETVDDPINFGEMITVGKFKIHYFCCVSVNLVFKLI